MQLMVQPMTDIMPQLQPIADILGLASVKADYSQFQIATSERYSGSSYGPGWRVQVDGGQR